MSYWANIYNRVFGQPREQVIQINARKQIGLNIIRPSKLDKYLTGDPVTDTEKLINLNICVIYPCYWITVHSSCRTIDNEVGVKVILPDNLNRNKINDYLIKKDSACGSKSKRYFATIDYNRKDLSKLKFCRINRQTKDIIRHYYKQIAQPTIIYN